MYFILFALSPCIVKEALLEMANVEYSKPLNKSKTTTQVNSCQYFQNASRQISTIKNANISKQTAPVCFSDNLYFFVSSDKTGKYSKNTSGNSPPKYILYKCLKLDIA